MLEKIHFLFWFFCSTDGKRESCHAPNYCNPVRSGSHKKSVYLNTNSQAWDQRSAGKWWWLSSMTRVSMTYRRGYYYKLLLKGSCQDLPLEWAKTTAVFPAKSQRWMSLASVAFQLCVNPRRARLTHLMWQRLASPHLLLLWITLRNTALYCHTGMDGSMTLLCTGQQAARCPPFSYNYGDSLTTTTQSCICLQARSSEALDLGLWLDFRINDTVITSGVFLNQAPTNCAY